MTAFSGIIFMTTFTLRSGGGVASLVPVFAADIVHEYLFIVCSEKRYNFMWCQCNDQEIMVIESFTRYRLNQNQNLGPLATFA